MGYSETLEAAGAKVIDYKEFGSYQGDWGAIVEIDGKRSLVIGSYGSCSGCDAFQAEFDYDDSEVHEFEGKYYKGYSWDSDPEHEITKEQYEEGKAAYQKRLADFGASYLQTLLDKSDIENKLANFKPDGEDWFSDEEKELYTWAYPFF